MLDLKLIGIASFTLLLACLIGLYFLGSGKPRSKAASKSDAGVNGAANGHGPVDSNKQRLVIFYGTQTGTAEKFAKSLAEEARRRYPETIAVVTKDLEGLTSTNAMKQLQAEPLAVFLQATYGDGEPTDTSAAFYKALTDAADAAESADGAAAAPLAGMSTAVFGLGNRQYEHFNSAGKGVNKALKALGATIVLPIGLGDDDGTLEEDYAAWRAELWPALEKAFPSLAGSEEDQARRGSIDDVAGRPAPPYEVQLFAPGTPPPSPSKAPAAAGKTASSSYTQHAFVSARVAERRELHKGGGRSCIHVELDLSAVPAVSGGSGKDSLSYLAGDHVAVLPENSEAAVEAACKLLGIDGDTVFKLLPTEGLPEPFEGPLTLREALRRHTDILGAPKKAALAALAEHCGDAVQAARLRRLASKEGRDEYVAFVTAPQRTLLEVLEAFPAARPPLGAFFGSIAPRLAPRYYSISSSPLAHPRSVHVTCALVRGPSPTGRLHEGVCSSWLSRAAPGGSVPVFLRSNAGFRLPADPSVPVVMVGPGTGLAPFRGFVQERERLVGGGKRVGPAMLFFGCRSAKHDYIYQEEMEAALASGALSALHVAYSRDAPGSEKVYVQHLLHQQGKAVWEALKGGAHFYVCGDAKAMAKDVNRCLHELVQKHGGLGNSETEAFVKALQTAGRYSRDVW